MAEAALVAPVALSSDDRDDVSVLVGELPALTSQLAEFEVLLQQNELEQENQRVRSEVARDALRQLEQSGNYTREQYQQAITQAHQSELRFVTVQQQQEYLRNRRETLQHLVDVITFAVHLAELLDPEAVKVAETQPGTPVERPREEPLPAPAAGQPGASAVIEAQEEERGWIARQLHNGPAQALTNLILRAEICERLTATDVTQARAELASLRQTIHQTLQEMRRFIFDVRPMILDDLGLFPALRRYVDDWNARGGPPAALTLVGEESRFPRPVELTVFRIVQDAIKIPEGRDNEQPVNVQLVVQEQALRVSIETPLLAGQDASRQPLPPGYETIQQRAAVVGGTASLESRTGARTLKVQIPVSAESPAAPR